MIDQIERDLIDAAPPLSSIDDNRVPMPSVMKEIFVGRFPTAILSYPDVLPKDRYLVRSLIHSFLFSLLSNLLDPLI